MCTFISCVIKDAESPVISSTLSSVNVTTNTDSAIATVSWKPPTATDNSGEAVTLMSDYNPGDNFIVGTTTVTYTAVDAYNNTATYSFAVVVTGNFC